MSDQQELTNRIFELAIGISTTPNSAKLIDVKYDSAVNQLIIIEVYRNGKSRRVYPVDLHEHGEGAVAQLRTQRQLLEVVTHLESLHAKPLQRSFI